MISAARAVASSASAAILHERGVALNPSGVFRMFPPTVGQFGDAPPKGKRLLEPNDRLADVAGRCGIASESGC